MISPVIEKKLMEPEIREEDESTRKHYYIALLYIPILLQKLRKEQKNVI